MTTTHHVAVSIPLSGETGDLANLTSHGANHNRTSDGYRRQNKGRTRCCLTQQMDIGRGHSRCGNSRTGRTLRGTHTPEDRPAIHIRGEELTQPDPILQPGKMDPSPNERGAETAEKGGKGWLRGSLGEVGAVGPCSHCALQGLAL